MSRERIVFNPTPRVQAEVPVDLVENVERVSGSAAPLDDTYDVRVRMSGKYLRSLLVQPHRVDAISLQPAGRTLELTLHAASVTATPAEAAE